MECNLGPFEACNGGDWSPRISFSHSFAMLERIARPKENPCQDFAFEFSSFVGADLPFEQRMLSADELFCDGKLRPLEKSSGNGQCGGKAGESKVPKTRKEVHFEGGREEMGGKAFQGRSPTSREELPFVGRCAEGGAPKSRKELLFAKRIEEEEEVVQMKMFSQNPRCASMTVEGSFRRVNRSCISLNTSRCPSPSRSFSLPSTAPASPTSTSSFSAFSSSSSSSSSSSKYCSRVMGFLKLKKLHLSSAREMSSSSETSSSSSCRLSISPRSFWPFSKSKECTNSTLNSLNSISTKARDAQNASMAGCVASKDGCSGSKDGYTASMGGCSASKDGFTAGMGGCSASKDGFTAGMDGCNASKDGYIASKDPPPLTTCKVSPKSRDYSHTCFPPVNCAKFPSQPTSSAHFTPSSYCKTAGSISPVDKTVQKPGNHAVVGMRSNIRHSHSLPHGKACGQGGPTMLVIDERVWDCDGPNKISNALNFNTHRPGKQGVQRAKKNMDRGNKMMGSRGIVRPKGLERPTAYTSSVRVTPVLNVPGCMTPSLRKTKPSSKPEAFSFGSLFATREKMPMAHTLFPHTHNPSGG